MCQTTITRSRIIIIRLITITDGIPVSASTGVAAIAAVEVFTAVVEVSMVEAVVFTAAAASTVVEAAAFTVVEAASTAAVAASAVIVKHWLHKTESARVWIAGSVFALPDKESNVNQAVNAFSHAACGFHPS
jgi:hypothetical protein